MLKDVHFWSSDTYRAALVADIKLVEASMKEHNRGLLSDLHSKYLCILLEHHDPPLFLYGGFNILLTNILDGLSEFRPS